MSKELTMESKTLADIGLIFNGNSINAEVKKVKYTNLEDGIPYIATKDISYLSTVDYLNGIQIPFSEKSNFKVAPKNAILICAEGGSAGRKIGFTNQEVCFGNKLFAFSSSDNIDSKYVYYYFFSDSFQNAFKSQMTGIIGGVSMNKFKTLKIPVSPLPQQKRIVATLDKAFAAIEKAKANAEQNLKNAKELFESYLQKVFENKGDDWEEKKIKNLTELITKGSSPKWQGIDYVDEGGIFFLTSKNVGESELLLNNKRYLDKKFNEIQKSSILNKGDVLTNIVGASIGRTAVFSLDEITNINQAVCLIRCNNDLLHNYYLMYLLNSPFFKNILHDNEVDNARANLSLTFFKNLLIPLPKIVEQKEIVERLKSFSKENKKLEALYTQKIADLEEMKKSVLQKAFSGQLNTVT